MVQIMHNGSRLNTSILPNHLTLNGIDNTLMIDCPRWMKGSRTNVMTL